jgi:hypothetical protein
MRVWFLVLVSGSYHDWFEVQSEVCSEDVQHFLGTFSHDRQTASAKNIPVIAHIRLHRRIGYHVSVQYYPGQK